MARFMTALPSKVSWNPSLTDKRKGVDELPPNSFCPPSQSPSPCDDPEPLQGVAHGLLRRSMRQSEHVVRPYSGQVIGDVTILKAGHRQAIGDGREHTGGDGQRDGADKPSPRW